MDRRLGGSPEATGRTRATYYRDKHSVEPVDRFIDALPAKQAEKIDDQIDEHLNGRPLDAPPPGFPITSQIDGGLWELRIRFGGTRYRVLYQLPENRPPLPATMLRRGAHRGLDLFIHLDKLMP